MVLGDGVEHIFQTDRVPLRDADGDVYAILGCARDVTASLLLVERTAELESFDRHYEDWIYLQAQLLYRAAAYADAVQLASKYSDEIPGGKHTQSAMTLVGLSLAMLGRTDQARSQLERAGDLDPESVSGKAAERALSQLTS